MLRLALALILIAAGLTFVRLVLGPTTPDRIVAANAVGIMFFSLLVLLSSRFQSDVFLDVALVYAVLQFADVLIMARYLGRENAGDEC